MSEAEIPSDEPPFEPASGLSGVARSAAGELEDVVELAARMTRAPVAVIVLEGPEGCLIAAGAGCEAATPAPLDTSLAETLLRDDAREISGLESDADGDSALAAGLGWRAWMSVRLPGFEGGRRGALVVADIAPRAWDGGLDTVRRLASLAGRALRQASARLEADAPASRTERAAERSLLRAQRIAHVGSWELHVPTQSLWWSREIYRIFGIPPAEFGEDYPAFLAAVHPDDRSAMERAQAAVLAGERRLDFEHRIVRPDGEVRWVHEQAELERSADGTPLRLTGTVHDITERRRAEDGLAEARRELRLILDSVGEGIHRLDADGCIAFQNRASAAMLGWEREKLIGRRSHETIHHHRADGSAYPVEDCPIHRTLRDGIPRSAEGEIFHRMDGSTFLVDYACSPMRSEDGSLTGVVVSFRDVTQRRQADERLREQAALLDMARDAVLVRGLDHRILHWNAGAERLYGWSRDEAIGRHVGELIYGEPSAFLAATDAVVRHGGWTGEILQRAKDGREIVVEGRWSLVRDVAGVPRSILAINTDVTERRRMEAHLLRTQRLESIGTLASGITHDLNNVLAPILLSIEELHRKDLDADAREILGILDASARRGADLVSQVHSFARGVEGERASLDPAALGRQIEGVVRDTFPKSIAFRLAHLPDAWSVTGDARLLHQALLNLCLNARDAMPDGGTIEMTIENVALDDTYAAMNPGSSPGPHVRISVADEGAGIPSEVRERMYEPFYTTKEFGKGTGLGLSTTHAIVTSHGGFMSVYSDPGRGARFHVYLPADASAGARESAEDASVGLTRGTGQVVLVVDDEEAIRQIARRTLEGHGYRVLLASNGAEAVAVFVRRRDDIAVVLTDMAMPVMDGAALVVALRALDPGVRIVASSGLAANGSMAKIAGAGVRHFIAKPYTAEAILRTLAEVLSFGS